MSDPFNFPQQELSRHGHLVANAAERMTRSGQLILGDGVRGDDDVIIVYGVGEGVGVSLEAKVVGCLGVV